MADNMPTILNFKNIAHQYVKGAVDVYRNAS